MNCLEIERAHDTLDRYYQLCDKLSQPLEFKEDRNSLEIERNNLKLKIIHALIKYDERIVAEYDESNRL
jgi:hypothetical protein